jgi:RNA polymerase sigma-70 factor (ECF subfamily)
MQSEADDRALLQATSRGDTKALERLFTRHNVRVFRFLMRIVANQAMAEELTNEVFLAAWQGASRYEGKSAPTTWLLSIAHNKAVSALRKRREVGGLDETAANEIADEEDTPEVASQKLDKARAMRAAIAELTPDHREILDLVYYQERTVAEVAEILAIPEATVKTRMFYARKKLSERLQAHGIDRGWP